MRLKMHLLAMGVLVCLISPVKGLAQCPLERAPDQQKLESSDSLSACSQPLSPGAGSFRFEEHLGNDRRTVTVWYYLPDKFPRDGNVVFVMHGVYRNGSDYRDNWIELAEKHNLFVVAPEFSEQNFPGGLFYQRGHVFAENGDINDPSQWTLTAIDRIFDRVVQQNNLKAKDYVIFGHSGGGQFVHRMILLVPQARARLAIVANAGWYTMPVSDIAYPYGLQNTTANKATLRTVLKRRVVVLLGEEDIDPNHKHLNRMPKAMQQGPHRFARGQEFFRLAQRKAKEHNLQFGWHLVTVPNVGHDNAKMAIPAVEFIKQKRIKQSRENKRKGVQERMTLSPS